MALNIKKNTILSTELLAIGKRLMLSPAFPLLHTERDSFPSFRVPSSDGFVNYKFQVTLSELGYSICSNSHFFRYLLIFSSIGCVMPKFFIMHILKNNH
jgi:hypothetical protein